MGDHRILLVDDNLDHVQLALRELKREPAWVVDTARTAEECLEKIDERDYDLVLLDYRLPDMTGLDVVKRVRKDGTKPPIILMTSQGSEEVAIQAMDAGADAYVVKSADFGRRLVYEVGEWFADAAGE